MTRIRSLLVRAAAALAALATLGAASGCGEVTCYMRAMSSGPKKRASVAERRELRRELKDAGVLSGDALAKLDQADGPREN